MRGTIKGGAAFLLALVPVVAAALALTGNAVAGTGVGCAPTGMETVATERDHYQAGEVAAISGGGYALGCDVRVDVERPDAVVEPLTATTDLSGSFALEYQVPPPPGVLGQYTVVVRGLDGAVLATTTFEDAPAPQFDIAPAHVSTTGTHVFSALVRNTATAAADTARCIRITTPASVTVASASFVVANPGTGPSQTGIWTLAQGANFVEVRTDTNTRRGIFGSAATSDNWVRFEITANLASAGTGTWTSRMVTSNASCSSGGSTDSLGVRVGGAFTRDYTADFRDASNGVIPAPTAIQGVAQDYRIRITRTAGSDDLSYAAVALPPCLTNLTGISTTNSGGSSAPDFVAQLTDNYFRFVTAGDKLSQNGQWTQVHFTATANCALGSHVFRTASWKNTSPETAQDDIFKLVSGTGHPTLTVLSANVAPTVAAASATVTVNEGQTAANTGVWADANATDTVTLSASVGTVTRSGTNGAGTWSWSYPTTDGPDETQTVTITASDGAASTSTTFELEVANVAPSATFHAPESVAEGSPIAVSLTDPSDPSSTDTAAGFQYRFSCDGGGSWTAWGSGTTHACPTDDGGTSDVAGEIRDKDGGTGSYGASVEITNVAPSATFTAPATVAEGTAIEISLTDASDPSSTDTAAGFQYRFSCDGGSGWTPWGTATTHACATDDDGTRDVRGQIRDKDGGTSSYAASVEVTNVAPSATFTAPASVAEGSDIALSLSDVVDPGTADTHEFRFKCGDLDWTAYGGSPEHSCATTDDGTITVRGQVRDDDGGESSEYSASVTVNNVAPSATFTAPASVAEGSDIALSLSDVVDPGSADTHEYRFRCGAGDWSDWGSDATHSCATTDNGSVTVYGQVRDDDGGTSDVYSADVAVTNVAPTATFTAPATVAEGSPIGLSLTDPSDPSSADSAAGFQYRFSCDAGSSWTAWGGASTHACPTDDDGTRDVRGQIRDKDGGTSSYAAEVTVTNVPPSATFTAPASVAEGSDIALALSDVVDPGSADTHQYRFSCDGGTTWTSWSAASTHACATDDDGSRSVAGQVRDDDGGTSPVYEASVTVTNVAPSATLNAPETVAEGSPIELSLTDVADPGSADSHQYRFSCDGGANWTPWSGTSTHSCSTDDDGSRSVAGQVRDDDDGTSPVYEASVTVTNVAPSATFTAPESVTEGSAIGISLSDPSDPSPADTAAGFEYRFSCDGGATWTPWGSGTTHECPTTDNGTKDVAGAIRDKDLGARSYSDSVTVTNVAPSATFSAPESVDEGTAAQLSLTSPSDPSSADTAAGFQYAFDCGDGSGYAPYSASNTRSCPTSDNGTLAVGGRIKDKDGGVSEYTATVAVQNVPPTLHSLTASSYAVPVGTAVTVTGTFSDPGTGDSFTCVVGWDDGSPAESVARPAGSTSCQASHTFTQQGVYSISMYVTDDDGGQSNTLTVIIAVYDPAAGGFVTGGGWINSPAGSYSADPAASGRANFGFSSQYKKGSSVPTGQTEFQLHFASFNFHSEAYEWLVVSGHKAQYKGRGRVNGASGYGFILTAYDGQLTPGGGADRFRIKIWKLADGVVVYDTKMGTPDDMDQANPLAISGGSIVIHKAK